MYNSFDDLRKCGFNYEDSLIYVYRAYGKKNHNAILHESPQIVVVSFEHFYAITLDLESRLSNLIRCKCGARNLLTQHVSSASLTCIFCVQKAELNAKLLLKKLSGG
jgi:hypothetical protein